MNNNNLFVQRRFQVQKDEKSEKINFVASIYVAYYFYVNGELCVTKYALCVRLSKKMSELKSAIS